jgi:hypothetical protein
VIAAQRFAAGVGARRFVAGVGARRFVAAVDLIFKGRMFIEELDVGLRAFKDETSTLYRNVGH